MLVGGGFYQGGEGFFNVHIMPISNAYSIDEKPFTF